MRIYLQITTYQRYKGIRYADVELSDSLGYHFLQESAGQGNLRAIGAMGLLYRNGTKDIPEDRKKSFEYLKKASVLDDPRFSYALASHYYLMADSVDGALQNALIYLGKTKKYGGKEYKWNVVKALAETYFRMGNYEQSSKYYKEWLNAYNHDLKLQTQYDNHEIDLLKFASKIKFDNMPWNFDVLVFAIESFIRSGDFNSLNLIPIYFAGNNYYNPSVKPNDAKAHYNFSSWRVNDPDYQAKSNLLNIIEERFVFRYPEADSLLSGLESIKLFYSLYDNPEPYDCYRRSRYYKKLNDLDNELKILNMGVNRGDLESALTLASYYFYGNDFVEVDFSKVLEILKPFEQKLHTDKLTGYQCSKGCYLLAKSYYNKDSGSWDYGKCMEFATCFLNAENYANKEMRGEIYRLLAICYRFGRGVEEDSEKAQYWNQKASECGEPNETQILNWMNNMPDENDKPPHSGKNFM